MIGAKDRTTMLPESLKDPLQSHPGKVKAVHRCASVERRNGIPAPNAPDPKQPNDPKQGGGNGSFPGRTIPKLLGQRNVAATMIDTHVMNNGGHGTGRPVDGP